MQGGARQSRQEYLASAKIYRMLARIGVVTATFAWGCMREALASVTGLMVALFSAHQLLADLLKDTQWMRA